MKLRIFKADKGDALLVSSGNGKKHVMVDGGMGHAYRDHCAKSISKLKQLDVVYVSHVDRDHVQGIYQMLDDTVAWKVHAFLKTHGHPAHKAPKHPKPPPITKFWQNNFRDQVDDNDGAISSMLASQAFTLSGHENAAVREIALEQQELGQSVGDALRVSWRIAEDQLDIPVNPEAGHKLISVSDVSPASFGVGKMDFTVIGPSEKEL
ncbi:MAG: MBL fold metallo-hydrolase, partial [Vicinamibacterales bacterium]|nr:MBL fold metallo-hydrolase [Vicinamibacterales bacterium]